MKDKYKETIYNLTHLSKAKMEHDGVFINRKQLEQDIKVLWELYNKYQELVDKETPKKFEIIDRDLIFHSTPHPTQYYLTIRCSCGGEFRCSGYQHWKVIAKHNVAKDYFEYEYSYCPHCGQKLDWSEE